MSMNNMDAPIGYGINTKLTIGSLPPEMMVAVFSHLDETDLKSSRLTCKSWCRLIDTLIPMSVVLDDMQQGNPEFIKSVIKKNIVIKSTSSSTAKTALCSPRSPQALKRMMMLGPVYRKIFVKEVLNFQNLETLIIGGETLLKRLSLQQSIYLPRLKKLILNSAFHCEVNFPVDSLRHQVSVARNTMEFLRNVLCPEIRELVLDGDVEQGRIEPKYDWKCSALIAFLQKYPRTLTKMTVGESSVLKSDEPNKSIDKLLATNLQNLHISFCGSSMPEDNFWVKFTLAQTNLEHLNVGALWYNKSHQFLANLPSSLRNLTLYWNLSESRSLSCSVFSKFANLERLELTFDGLWGQHLAKFPLLKACINLKVLVLEQLLISAKHLENISEYLPKLEVLYLYACGDAYNRLHCSLAPFGISEVALTRFLWEFDELFYLHVCPEDFLGDESTVQQMNAQISLIAKTRKGCKGYYIGQEPDWLMENTYDCC